MIFAELIAQCTQRLDDAGCDCPRWDAEELIMHAFGMSRTDLLFARREAVSDTDALKALESMIGRRQAREPLQHIIGSAPMMGLELHVGPGVFVPRPETELLAQWAIERAQAEIDSGIAAPKVVDLCTGSGALALAIADAVPAAEVIAVELDPVAYQWAQRNLETQRQRWADLPRRVRLLSGDVTDEQLIENSPELSQWAGQVDIVVSNPPYVPEETQVSAEVHQDPHHAVFGGADGLEVIRPMMWTVDRLLRDGGVVGIEHDDDSGEDMRQLLGRRWRYDAVTCHPDLNGRDRFTTGTKLNN